MQHGSRVARESAPTGVGHIGLFLKAPKPGLVKTRLAKAIGNEQACSIYRHMVELQVSNVPAGWPITVHHDPPDAEPLFRNWLGSGVHYAPQVPGDLGARLASAMQGHFARHSGAWFALGGDCPGLDSGRLCAALEALQAGADIVLGPATDGGYYLLGLTAPHWDVFSDIPWSSVNTLGATLQRARTLGASIALLDPLSDVDDLASLNQARADGLLP